MSMPAKGPIHDMALYEALCALAFAVSPEMRKGRMFGAPAVYVGRRMAGCVFGAEVGLRVPAEVAALARQSGRANAFTPYGKRPMREWIALDLAAGELCAAADLIAAAMAFSRDNDER